MTRSLGGCTNGQALVNTALPASCYVRALLVFGGLVNIAASAARGSSKQAAGIALPVHQTVEQPLFAHPGGPEHQRCWSAVRELLRCFSQYARKDQ